MSQQQPVVELRDACRYYETRGEEIHALDHVSLTVHAGEFTALAGPSGSGKSTMLNVVGALDRPTSGSVFIEGRDIGQLNGKERSDLRRTRIGFVFQSYNLIPVMSVLENVEYVMLISGVDKRTRHEEAKRVLDRLGLGDKLHRRPTELSGGQQQRVAVARAIVSKPAIVLADEPTANLDSHTGEGLLDMMAELNRELGTTFIFCTHDQSVMQRARRLIRLRDGRVESDEKREAARSAS